MKVNALAILITIALALQGWTLSEVVRLKEQVAILNTRLDLHTQQKP